MKPGRSLDHRPIASMENSPMYETDETKKAKSISIQLDFSRAIVNQRKKSLLSKFNNADDTPNSGILASAFSKAISSNHDDLGSESLEACSIFSLEDKFGDISNVNEDKNATEEESNSTPVSKEKEAKNGLYVETKPALTAILQQEESNTVKIMTLLGKQMKDIEGASDNKSTGDAIGSARLVSENMFNTPRANDNLFNDSITSDKSGVSKGSKIAADAYVGGAPVYKKSRFHTQKEKTMDNKGEENTEENKAEEKKAESTCDIAALEKPSSSPQLVAPLIQRARTGLGDWSKEIQAHRKNKSFTMAGDQSHEQFEELGKAIQEKKRQIKVYEAIQTQAKVVINQNPYTAEMDLSEKDFSLNFAELVKELKSESVKTFTQNFIELLHVNKL